MSSSLLNVKNLTVDFRLEDGSLFHALKGINFSIPRNTTVALVGSPGQENQ
ncbi:hypothetical protein P4S72_30145 [Vibrio sp. PP-XX7]